MRDRIYIKDNRLIIDIPLQVETSNCYDPEDHSLRDNIIGIIEPVENCSSPNCGFAYRIDMSYAGKPDQWTKCFYDYSGNVDDFTDLCKELKIEIYRYTQCAYCKKPISGCFTIGDKGNMCYECELKRDDEIIL